MHGFSSGSTFLVNAEVDSMGGVVDGGVGIGTKPSPRRAAIEKAQAELRLEYDVREERKRELEFLEKGGNPLDFKFGRASSVSVLSISHTDHHPDQNLTSEAKGSFALTASPHGDSVESSGRLGITTAFEPNSADNFDGENEILQNVKKSMHTRRGNIIPSEHSSQLDGSLNVREDSQLLPPKEGQAYKRRNRSRTNRDATRSSSVDMASRGGHASPPGRHGMLRKFVASEIQSEMVSDGTNVLQSPMTSRAREVTGGKLNVLPSKEQLEEVQNPSLKADEPSVAARTVDPALVAGKDNIDIVDDDCRPCSGAEKTEDNGTFTPLNSTGIINGDDKRTPTDAPVNSAPKGLDCESSCTQTNVSVDGNGNFDCVLLASLENVDSNLTCRDLKLAVGEKSIRKDDILLNEKHIDNAMENASCDEEDQNHIDHQGNGFAEKDHCGVDQIQSPPKEEAKGPSDVAEHAQHEHAETKSEKELGQPDNCIPKMESSCAVRLPPSVDPFPDDLTRNDLIAPSNASESQACTKNQLKQLDKENEDRILEEARIIEAKRKRIAELSIGLLPREQRRKAHWDFVVEEMAWLANDFAQERIWKMTAAAQICHRVAFASRIRLEDQRKYLKQKSVALILAKAVVEFWQSARLSVGTGDSSLHDTCNHEAPSGAEETILTEDNAGNSIVDKACQDMLLSSGRKQDLGVYKYAVRFLQLNCSSKPLVEVEVPETPYIACDVDYPEVSWQDQFNEESLFYVVPPSAMEIYRKSIESCLSNCKKFGSVTQEEVDTSAYDAAVEVGYQENDYEEDEGENLYYLPRAIDAGKPSKKKRKSVKSYGARPYEIIGGYGNMAPQSVVMGKRPANTLHVDPIPTKRMRTASRQRVVGPFSPGPAGVAPGLSRADASSGDTNSYPDDQSTLHGGSVAPRGTEVNSTMNFEMQSTFDSADISAKPKKKKKVKYQSATYDQRWQLDSSMHIDQKEVLRKRLDSHQLDSNGHSGLIGQHAKKPKLMKYSLETSFDNTMPMSGSIASPAASQMSNMSSQSKIIKLIGGRDRARKSKGFKVSNGQLGSGSPWTVVEDQALVVLVHDMGPNWELVSDAMNSILQFKCIFRKPQECKERHKFLMDRPSGDGADSAEDSGSSQPYPSTLPGIPKGSARQLFRSLHAALEEDNIKSRFEKIIYIEQQLHYRKKQGESQDLKHIAPIHSSHVVALTQVIPNNVNGGVLTPLDHCDTAAPNQDPLSIGYSSHAGGFPPPKQGSISSMHPSGGLSSPLQGLQGSPSLGVGNNVASPSSQLTSSRDARYAVPRSSSLPIEEQQRLHQYNSITPGRNVPPSSLSTSGNDRGARMLPGGNGVGMMPGMGRPVPIARPGLQGVPSSSMLNSGNVLTSNVGGMTNNMNVHSGAAAGQGNAMFRPRESLHVVRPGQSSEHQRQMVLPEMQMQATQPSSSGGPSLGGLSSGYSNQTASPPLQTYAGHQQLQHPMPQQHPNVLGSPHPHLPTSNHSATPEQTAYIRIARERQLQQRMLQRQQHQQHPASSALMTHVQSSSQLPLSSPLQNSSQLQSPSLQPVSLPSSSPPSSITPPPLQLQQQQKHQLPSQGFGRSGQSGASGLVNQIGKPRQRHAQQVQQQYQQSARQHPQQRQQSQSLQSKALKDNGRSNLQLHPTLPMDPSLLNGLSANPGSQVPDKGEPTLPLVQGQGLHSGSSLNTLPASKSLASSTQLQKLFANTGPASSKPAQLISSQLDNGNQCQSRAASSPPVGLDQGLSATVPPSANHEQLKGQPHSSMKVANQSQPTVHRAQQNCQVNSDTLTKSQAGHSLLEKPSSTAGGVPVCVDSSGANSVSSSSSNAVWKVLDSVCDSAMTSVSSSSGPGSTQAVTNSLGSEQSPSVSEGLGQRHPTAGFVSHGHGSQWQNQSSWSQPPPPAPMLLQKQLKQRDQRPLKVPQPHIQAAQKDH